MEKDQLQRKMDKFVKVITVRESIQDFYLIDDCLNL